MIRLILTCLVLGATLNAASAELAEDQIPSFGGCYFAPASPGGLYRMRDQDGAIREFEWNGKALVAAGGWKAVFKDGTVTVLAPANDEYPPLKYEFKGGRLAFLTVGKRRCRFNYSEPVVYEDEEIAPILPSEEELSEEDKTLKSASWEGGKRLRLWFASPNQAGAFVGFVLVLALTWAFYVKGTFGRVLAILLSVTAGAGLILTSSRGAFVAVLAASVLVVVCRLHHAGRLSVRRLVIVLCVLAGLGAAAYVGARYATGRNAASDSRSDRERLMILRAAPRMMCDAPWGWGRLPEIGRAYSNWYAPEEDRRQLLNLVNDHLTVLVASGWLVAGLYLFAWSAGLLLLCGFAWKGGSPAPAAVWLILFITSLLNVVLFVPAVHWLPIATLVIPVVGWRKFDKRLLLGAAGGGLACVSVVLGAIWAIGANTAQEPSVRKDGKAVCVNGVDPDICVVADAEVLGIADMERSIRKFYATCPKTAAVRLVSSVDDIPNRGVRRLVLTGRKCSEFLRAHTKAIWRNGMPPEILFVSPDVSPAEMADQLRAKARFAYVIGEFAARYHSDLADPPKWCTIVPGAEIYIPGWMRFCVN